MLRKKYSFKLGCLTKAQEILEYAALIAIVIGGLIAMQSYLKRGVQGKLKSSSDQVGEQYSPKGHIGKSGTYTLTKERKVTTGSGYVTTAANSIYGHHYKEDPVQIAGNLKEDINYPN